MLIFLPWRGEFGQMVMTYVRWVHSLRHTDSERLVCCQRDHRCLFPSATRFEHDWDMPPDEQRCTDFVMGHENRTYLDTLAAQFAVQYPGSHVLYPLNGSKPQRFKAPHEHITLTPYGPEPSVYPDVLVAPRFRRYGMHRNYPHWLTICSFLRHRGIRYGLIGVRETSIDDPYLDEVYKSWSYEHNLDTTIRWMQRCRLVLCTDSGLAHVAVLAQAPLAVIYEKPGVEHGKESWKWCFPKMKAYATAFCEPIVYGWSDVGHVIRWLERYLQMSG